MSVPRGIEPGFASAASAATGGVGPATPVAIAAVATATIARRVRAPAGVAICTSGPAPTSAVPGAICIAPRIAVGAPSSTAARRVRIASGVAVGLCFGLGGSGRPESRHRRHRADGGAESNERRAATHRPSRLDIFFCERVLSVLRHVGLPAPPGTRSGFDVGLADVFSRRAFRSISRAGVSSKGGPVLVFEYLLGARLRPGFGDILSRAR